MILAVKINSDSEMFHVFLQNDPIMIGPAEFACPYCSKIMKKRKDMTRHIMIHTGEKPFSCTFCNFRANQKSTVNEHVKRRHASSYWSKY